MPALTRPVDLCPPQGYTDLCWAASLVLAANYQGYNLVRDGYDLRTADGLEAFVESVADALGFPSERRTGFVGTDQKPGRVEVLASLLGIHLAPRMRGSLGDYVEDWLERDCPVIVRWNPAEAGVPTYRGAHFSVATLWSATEVHLADPYGGTRGSRCEWRVLRPDGKGWGQQAIAVLPPAPDRPGPVRRSSAS